MSSVLQESASSTLVKNKAREPTWTYHGRGKPDLVYKQLQLSEAEVRTENNSSAFDSQNFDPLDPDPDDLPIALRKGKKSSAKYPVS